jgi:hypothetical protein
MKRILLIVSLCLIMPVLALSQGVTTSSMAGMVTDENNEPLIGANVVAVHQPSGTTYGTSSDIQGLFRIPGMRVGGPYIVRVTYAGYSSVELDNLFLRLGEVERRNFVLREDVTELESIVFTAQSGTAGLNSGASTQISSENIQNLPSLDRGINDFVRLTPQSSAYGQGISIAGTNNRFNAIYIDGAVNNDVFGLADTGTNGGQTGISPFSLDIIDQLQVVISPYDVTLGGFAGGGINAVTRSGTNQFSGSVYRFIQNETFVGKTNKTLTDRFDGERTRVDEFTKQSYGISIGGPIIRDRLFFFMNAEIQDDQEPRPFDINEYTSVAGRAQVADLDRLRNHLIDTYNYDPGTFGNTSRDLEGQKLFLKLDFNLNQDNKFTLRHQYTNGESFGRNSGNRNTVNFSNNGVYFPTTTNSTAFEWNSIIGNQYSNNLILSYVRVRDDRGGLGDPFPYVFINDAGNGQIRFGTEEFSTANQLDQDIFSITNNFNIYRGNHTITLGTHNEFYSIYNLFIPQNFGTYRFASIDAFINNERPTSYVRAYSLVDNITGSGTAAAADFNAMQLGFYAQNEWKYSNRLTLTGGLRIDIPIITSNPEEDTYLNNTALPAMRQLYPIARDTRAGKTPDGQIMFSPRVGFTYNTLNDMSMVVRGGAGVFTSRIPFVWPGAMFNQNGLTQGSVNLNNLPDSFRFISDVNNQPINPNFSVPSGDISLFTKDFKYPQVFRSNVATDFELPFGIQTTLEAIYTKTLNNIVYTNINSDPTVAFRWTGSPDNRPVYSRSSIDDTYSAVYLASNTSRGYGYNLSASFSKVFDFGLDAMLAYSYGDSKSLSEGTSSQNSSQWRGQVNVDGRNFPSYGRSDFAAGHRLISAMSYRQNWSRDRNNSTTISLFMNAQQGLPFSYVIGGGNGRNINNETGSTGRNRSLVFVPENASQINLVPYTVGGTTVSAAEQWERLNAVIEDDSYLKSRRGKYAEKNGSFGPFTAIFDVSLRQDVGLNVAGQRHRMQFSFDIQNFANLLNPKWGVVYTIPGDFNNYFLYTFEGYEADGTTPRFTFRDGETGRDRFGINSAASRWRMQFGVRYMFN